MRQPDQGAASPSRIGCVVALGLMLLPGAVLSMMAGPMLGEEWPFVLLYGLFLATPFAYLGMAGTKDRLPWLVAILLTVLCWGAFAASVFISAREQSGVNIGMALAMLGSPFLTTLGTWAANRRRS